MRAEIVSIGTELLLGQITDTNAVFISSDLAARGIDLWHRSTVGDNLGRVCAVLRMALERADVVITIAGLGPTQDDLTKEAVSEVTGIALLPDPDAEEVLRAFFERRGLPCHESNFKQTNRPEQGLNLKNPNGTAPGAVFDLGAQAVICLPGPPSELIPMWNDEVVPWLGSRGFLPGEVLFSRTLRFVGIGESLLEPRISDLMQGANPTVAPYAKTGEVHIRITAKAADEAAARAMIAEKESEIRSRVGEFIYGVDDETLESAVVRALAERKLTMATAESCTGGLIASRISDVPGSSEVFLEGLVCYSNQAKTSVLGVPAGLIEAHGAVSEEVAIAMAEGARRVSGADIAVSDTGIAGPGGGSKSKPVGLVWLAISTAEGTRVEKSIFAGGRATVKLRASQAALALIRQAVVGR